MRTFIALELPREILLEIVRIQDQIKKQSLFNGKYTEARNLHLTIKFLGEVKEEEINSIKEILSNVKLDCFEATLGEIGVFSKNKPRIIWIKLNGKGIFELQKQIDEKLKDRFPIETRFMSHITIARTKDVSYNKGLVDYISGIKNKKIKFIVNSFYLKKSELFPAGPIYTDIEKFSFDKKIN
ncbi:MAG: RNA 2',3'-cyclic phosphodiesterase [Candidatus Pacearchaeota archaeon]|jgi:2'-5' RNA ligase